MTTYNRLLGTMAHQVDRNAIPGTFTLVDLEHTMASRHLDHGNSDIVLVPQPSDDPDDPLNWSPRRKLLSTICVSAPYIKSNGEWIGRSILCGFFIAPIEALPEVSVTDVYFTHERGTYMALYAFFLAGSNYFAPVICGFIAQYHGWRWVFYWPAIFIAVTVGFLFFFMEETNYTRHTVGTASAAGLTSSATSSEKGDKEKTPADAAPQQDAEYGVVSNYSKRTFAQKLAIIGPTQPNNMLRRFWHILYYVSWPVVFYAGFSYGSYLIWFNILNGTASIILGSAPYNFGFVTPTTRLIVNSSLFTGRFSDWLTIRLARRNNGVMEAEQRLWPFLVCLITVPGSLILWGVGAAHEIHWFGLLVAMCVLASANTCGVTLSVNYLVDSYSEVSGDAMSSIILVRNTMSFAFNYGITPWIENLGYQNCFISAAFIGVACSAVFLFMIKYGKTFRTRSRAKYWDIVVENRARGMGH
ncbi:hypothetical protein ATERTT37_001970 [Aspergillus terreus]